MPIVARVSDSGCHFFQSDISSHRTAERVMPLSAIGAQFCRHNIVAMFDGFQGALSGDRNNDAERRQTFRRSLQK